MTESALTLRAQGPAVIVRDRDHDDLAVTETQEVDLAAVFDIDHIALADHGSVTKQGAIIRERDIAEHVAETLSDDDRTYRAGHERHDDWTLQLHGRVDDWLTVAVEAASAVISVGSDDRVATTACDILADLAEYGSGRPLLAMLDLLARYDIDGHSREDVLADLADAPAPGSALPAEQETADD
jgi:hypothetical protein